MTDVLLLFSEFNLSRLNDAFPPLKLFESGPSTMQTEGYGLEG